jgi:hypothetical protein
MTKRASKEKPMEIRDTFPEMTTQLGYIYIMQRSSQP